MLTLWFVLLLASFAVSVLALTRIQMRVGRRLGWAALHRDPLRHYWTELTRLERVLVWCGIAMFLLTLFAAALWTIVRRAA